MCKRIKQSDWPWKFWCHRVFHYSHAGLVLPQSVKQWPNLHPSYSFLPPHQIFTFSPWKPYSNLSLLEVGDEILKTKNGNKSFQQKNNSLFLGNPYKIFSLWCTLLQELNSFYSPTKNLEIPVQLLISNEGCKKSCCFESLWKRLPTCTSSDWI